MSYISLTDKFSIIEQTAQALSEMRIPNFKLKSARNNEELNDRIISAFENSFIDKESFLVNLTQRVTNHNEDITLTKGDEKNFKCASKNNALHLILSNGHQKRRLIIEVNEVPIKFDCEE